LRTLHDLTELVTSPGHAQPRLAHSMTHVLVMTSMALRQPQRVRVALYDSIVNRGFDACIFMAVVQAAPRLLAADSTCPVRQVMRTLAEASLDPTFQIAPDIVEHVRHF
jgi:hypothetical protein